MVRAYALVVMGMLLLASGATAKTPAATAGARVAHGDSLSVMTINLWHKDRPSELNAMAGYLQTNLGRAPDVILCQEVMFKRGGRLDNTAAVLANSLGYYSRGTKRRGDSEGIAIVSRFPFEYYAEKHLKSQTSRLLLGFRRVSVMGEFQVPGVGLVRVVNVHFTNWKFERHVRDKQLRETLDWIVERERRVPAAVTLIGGDFNAERDWAEMRQMEVSRLGGRVRFCDFNSTEPSKGPLGNPNTRIDHIFVSAPELPVYLAQETLLWKNGLRNGSSHFYPSDHLGLVHVYSFREPMQYARRTPTTPASPPQASVETDRR